MRCLNCLTPLDRDMLFCPECGRPVPPELHKDDDPEQPTAVEITQTAPDNDTADAPDSDLGNAADDLENDAGDLLALEDDIRFLSARLAAQLDTMDSDSREDAADESVAETYLTPASPPEEPAQPVQSPQPFEPLSDASAPPLPIKPPVQSQPIQRYGYVDLHQQPPIYSNQPPAFSNQPPAYPGQPPANPMQPPMPPAQDSDERPARKGINNDFGDGYMSQPTLPEEKYRATGAGKKVASVFLCILAALMLVYTVLGASARLTLTKDNIRQAAATDKMMRQSIIIGNTNAVGFVRDLIGSDELSAYGFTDEMLENALRAGRIPELFGNILIGYTDYFLYDKDSEYLNAAYITAELERFNADLSIAAGLDYTFDAVRVDRIAERINGGDLSFLSIDSEGGWFYRHYGVNPELLATIGSPLVLIICGVIALLSMILIFVLNSANPPAGLTFNGVTLIIVGSFYLLTAIGCLILSFIKDIWIITELLRMMALWTGIISSFLLVTGIIFAVVAGSLRRKAKLPQGQDPGNLPNRY